MNVDLCVGSNLQEDKALLYRSSPNWEPGENNVWKTVLRNGDRDWELAVVASEQYLRQKRHWATWVVGAVAVVMTGLMQLLLFGITGRSNEVERTSQAVNAYLDNLFNCANVSILTWNADGTITRCSTAFETLTGKNGEEIRGGQISMLFPPDQAGSVLARINQFLDNTNWDTVELPIQHQSGSISTVLCNLATIFGEDGITPVATIAQGYDITDRKQAQQQLVSLNADLIASLSLLEQEMSERQKAEDALHVLNSSLERRVEEEVRKNREKDGILLHQEKLASIGQLAAGVAHEINNPIGFVMANLKTLTEYTEALQDYCQLLEEQLAGQGGGANLQDARNKLDIDYILGDLGPLLAESTEGAERVRRIVLDLKDFARPDENSMHDADLNQLVQSTSNIVRSELKYVARLDLQLGKLSRLICQPQQINQVISNLLVNAAQSIEDQGVITVRTWQEDNTIFLSVADTGKGIPQEIMQRIFDPFFTTKEVGKGTGLGLAICHDIITKHGGEIAVASEVGKGSVFTVSFPW